MIVYNMCIVKYIYEVVANVELGTDADSQLKQRYQRWPNIINFTVGTY